MVIFLNNTINRPSTGDAIFDAIIAFTQSYIAAVGKEVENNGRRTFSHHGERIGWVHISKARDGYVTFYMPPPKDSEHKEGFYVYDDSKYDLNSICQSLHLHRLKVAPPMLGQGRDAFNPIPPDTEPLPGLSGPFFHDDIRRAAVEGKISTLQGMTISPLINMRDGVRERVLPHRLKIWSPVFEFPGVGPRRLYYWTHADFWWLPEHLNLDPERATEVAHYDFVALHTVLAANSMLTPQIAQNGMPDIASRKLEEICNEFSLLLEEDGDNEEIIHQFLHKAESHILLDSDYKEVLSKVQLGKYVSDFVVRRADDSYKLVEIESAMKRIFTKSKSEPSKEFNHACQQVRDWQHYIREHVHHVRDVQKLTRIYEPKGMIMMGRSADIDSNEARQRWRAMKAENKFKLNTYDDAIERVQNLATKLRNLMK